MGVMRIWEAVVKLINLALIGVILAVQGLGFLDLVPDCNEPSLSQFLVFKLLEIWLAKRVELSLVPLSGTFYVGKVSRIPYVAQIGLGESSTLSPFWAYDLLQRDARSG